MMVNKDFIQSIVCSLQRALLGNVTENLRAVNVIIKERVVLMFYYDSLPSEEEEELASLTDTGFLSDFPELPNDFKIIHLPYPAKIPEGLMIFQRYEVKNG